MIFLNNVITSRINLINSAKEIAYSDGISKVSIREVAKKSGVSVGCIYNYFSTKKELIIAVVEDFWITAFNDIDLKNVDTTNFIECFKLVYSELSSYLSTFQNNWLEQLSFLKLKAEESGRKKELDYFSKIKGILVKSLTNDINVKSNLWNDKFTKDEFIAFIFENMLNLLKNGRSDCDYLVQIIKIILYQ